MKILIVTDAWEPQVNGVVRTLKSTRRELQKMGHEVELLTPLEFRTVPCPVAAYPVTGPVDVIGDSPAGALDEDLRAAAMRALMIDRSAARRHAELFSWEACTRQFLGHLHPFDVYTNAQASVDGQAP